MIRKNFPMAIDHTWTDKQGRYTAVSGRWEDKTLTLVSMYVPPGLHTLAFKDLDDLLLALPEGMLLMRRL